MRTVFLALALTTAVVACRTASSNTLGTAIETAANPDGDSTSITVKVENRGFSDARVYIVSESGSRMRIGTAPGHTDTILTLPNPLSYANAQVRFLVDPIGGGGASLSDQIVVAPGDQVTLTIPPN